MRSPSRFRSVHRTAGWLRTARLALPFLLSGLVLAAAPPVAGQTPAPLPAAPVEPVERFPPDDPFAVPIAEAARRFRLPAGTIRAVLTAESGGDLRVRYGLGSDPFDPRDSILAGAAYLRELLDRYGSPGFLAAYNAGPARYQDSLAGRPLPDETRAYLAALKPLVTGDDPTAGRMSAGIVAVRSWTMAPLFAGHAERTPAAGPPQPGRSPDDTSAAIPLRDLSAILPQSDGLFVALSRPRPDR